MFIAALITVAKMFYQLTNGLKKMFLDTIKSYLAIKRNEVLIHATTWMNFEHIMLSERSQAKKKKVTYCRILFI